MTPFSTLISASADPVIEIQNEKLNPAPDASLTGQLDKPERPDRKCSARTRDVLRQVGQVVWVGDQYVDHALLPELRWRSTSIFRKISRARSAANEQSWLPIASEGRSEGGNPNFAGWPRSGNYLSSRSDRRSDGSQEHRSWSGVFHPKWRKRQSHALHRRSGPGDQAGCATRRQRRNRRLARSTMPDTTLFGSRQIPPRRPEPSMSCRRRSRRDLTFIAKPSRLPVALHNAITGSAYVFDAYGNLITKPMQVSFQLSNPGSAPQTRTVETRNGAAWTQMDSAAREGKAQFIARVRRYFEYAHRRPGSWRSLYHQDERQSRRETKSN